MSKSSNLTLIPNIAQSAETLLMMCPRGIKKGLFYNKCDWVHMELEVYGRHVNDNVETKLSENLWSPPSCGGEYFIFQKRVGEI